jgi:hypothetical protein
LAIFFFGFASLKKAGKIYDQIKHSFDLAPRVIKYNMPPFFKRVKWGCNIELIKY